MITLLRRMYAVIRWYFRPAIVRRKVIDGVHPPRLRAAPAEDRTFLFNNARNLDRMFEYLGEIWDREWRSLFLSEHSILIKINLNTADPYPASTDPVMLAALLRFLREKNLRRLWVGDCSSVGSVPTKKTVAKAGIMSAIEDMADLLCFDDGPWVSVPISGYYMTEVTVPKVVMEVDRIISLANIKSHGEADFSLGMKLAVGFMHPLERVPLHRDHLREKIPEISLAVQPDLTIIDGRTIFITGGPRRGETARCDTMVVGTDVVKADVAAYRVLVDAKKKNNRISGFTEEPFDMLQFSHARKVGLIKSPVQEVTTIRCDNG